MAGYFEFDRLLDDAGLAATHAAIRAARFEMLINEAAKSGFAAGLVARHDAVREFLATGGLSGRPVELRTLADRTNFFRATLAYGARLELPEIEPFWRSERFAAAAAELFGATIVEPTIVFANAALPGQEIGLHTDVPEFRGLDRDAAPEWLLVVMHHSGLFAAERVAIATGVAWFGEARGGAFWSWPEGPEGQPRVIEIADDRAVLLDTDTVVHAVAPVAWTSGRERPLVEVGAALAWDPERERWAVEQRGVELTTLDAADVRVSISWKAWCFADAAARERARAGADGITLAGALERLRRDLADRGRLPSAEARIADVELAMLLLDEYLRFPASSRSPPTLA